MGTLSALLALCTGLLLRLALPIAVTLVAVSFLRKLDARWQAEAELQAAGIVFEKPECWKIKNCLLGPACPTFRSPVACWQARRLPNGYLRDECLTCEVFLEAPIPQVQVPA